MATEGTTTASSTRTFSLVVTSVPGHSVSLGLSMIARTVTMPVATSTVFSIIATLPVSEPFSLSPGNEAITLATPLFTASCRSGKHALRHAERDVDWRDLVDGGERRDVGRTHEVADLDVSGTDATRDRRADDRVALLDPQVLQLKLVGLNGAAQRIHLGLGVVDVELRRGALADQFAVALEVALGAGELSTVTCQRAFGLRDLRIDLPGIQHEQNIARLHPRAVLEVDFGDRGLDAGFQRDTRDRRHRADGIDLDRNLLALGVRDLHGDRAATARRPLGLCLGCTAHGHPRRARRISRCGHCGHHGHKDEQTSFFHDLAIASARSGAAPQPQI